jgi:hypothetical protein
VDIEFKSVVEYLEEICENCVRFKLIVMHALAAKWD